MGRPDGERVCILSANWRKLTFTKVKGDIDKFLQSRSLKPDRVRVICGQNISSELREKVKEYAHKKNIYACDMWSA